MEAILQGLKGVNGQGIKRYTFSFQPNGTANPAVATIAGKGIASITYLASNMWLVNFVEKFQGIQAFSFGIRSNAGGPGQGFSINLDNANSSLSPAGAAAGAVLALASVNAAGTRATIANDANTWICCSVDFTTDPLNVGQ